MKDTAMNYRCPHCGTMVEISEGVIGETVECPQEHCGKPFTAEVPSVKPATRDEERKYGGAREHIDHPADDEETILVVHPAMFRNRPIRYLVMWTVLIGGVVGVVFSLLGMGLSINGTQLLGASILLAVSAVLALLGVVVFLIWFIRVKMTTLTVTSERTMLREGILSRDTTEVRHTDVRNLQIDQNMGQRIMGVGDLAISSSGQDDLELIVRAIPKPSDIADLVRDRQ